VLLFYWEYKTANIAANDNGTKKKTELLSVPFASAAQPIAAMLQK
jgi:hypothetical protein